MSLEDVVKRRLKEKQEKGQKDLAEKVKERIRELENQPEKNEDPAALQFFKSGGFSGYDIGSRFEDGWQVGDVVKTGLDIGEKAVKTYGATVGDVWTSALRGLGGVSEGIGDAITYLTAGIMDATDGTDKKGAADRLRKETQKNVMGNLLTFDAINENSLLGSTSQGILEGVGQGVGTMAANAVGGPLLSGAMMFVSGVGHGMTEAYQGGATNTEAALYGLGTGAWEAITETLSGGLGKAAQGLGISKGLGGIDDKIASAITQKIKNKVVSNLIQAGVKAGGEGLEELLSYGGQVVAKKLTYLSEKDWEELWDNQEALENFVVGMMSSAILQTGDVIKTTNQGRDFVTGRTAEEQSVIDKVYKDRVDAKQTDDKKLTAAEKNKILAEVENDLEAGNISIADIEAVLGGEAYQKYQDAVKQEKETQAEFDEINALKVGERTGVQSDRLEVLRQQIADSKKENITGKLQSEYQQAAEKLASTGRLAESYRERARRSEAFTADLSQYTEKQRATVKKAIDSGILNNTNKSHTFVDLIAKVAGDTGVEFNFTDNQKLKDSGFALPGLTVNGYKDQNGVTINIHSAKALNSVVGHEITHVLEEGTKMYDTLKEAVFSYAKSKGEFDSRRSSLEKLYEKVQGADIDTELAADLVGDYLFTDADFVRSLHAEHRNVFQKVYDEIKHLLKLATAGSKEARQLEKVKQVFEKTYREAAKAEKSTAEDGGVKYSLVGRTAEGFGIYKTNYPLNTPKKVKQAEIISLIQNVWSNNPIKLTIVENGEYADITAKFNPELGERSDLAKIAFGNRKGNGQEKRMTLDLGSDLYQIAEEAKFSYSKEAIPKPNNPAHDGVTKYHYFVTNIVYKDNDGNYIPCHMNIDVKRNAEGDWFYSFAIEKGSVPQALLAAGTDNSATLPNGIVTEPEENVNQNLSPSSDNAYLRLVDEGDTKAAQKMVEKAAKEAGYTIKAYHGTDAGVFNEFDKGRIGEASGLSMLGDGFYFSDRESTAKQYGKNVFPVYLKQLNPYNATAADVYKLNALELERQGYDSVILQTGKRKVLMVLDPNQVKSAATVTYDDNGNVIPLSERFNQDSNDMRHSLSSDEDMAPVKGGIYGKDVLLEAPVRQDMPTVRAEQTQQPVMEAPVAGERDVKAEEKVDPKSLRAPVYTPNVWTGQTQTAQEVETVETNPKAYRERLRETIRNLRKELDENAENKKLSAESYDQKIRELQEKYNNKKHKDSKASQSLLRQIARQKRLKAEEQANYDRRIERINERINRIGEQLLKDTGRADWRQTKEDKIDAKLEQDKAELQAQYEARKAELQAKNADKDKFIADRAMELYEELRGLQKGVKASPELGYFLDQGYSWNAIKSALLIISNKPSANADKNWELGQAVREKLAEDYDSSVYEELMLDTQHEAEMAALEQAAKDEKALLAPARVKSQVMTQYQTEVQELVGDTSTWKDKSLGLMYATNTLRRNLRDIVRDENGNPDIEKADRIYDYLQGNYNLNEASLNTEANRRKAPIRDLKLNKYEDEYGQMLGEFRHNPGTTLLPEQLEEYYEKHKDKIDTAKVDKAIEMLRAEYDELFEWVNSVLREQGFKEIEFRKGYFPHFTEEKQNWFQKLINWKPKNNDIPTDIAGMTEEFNPQRSWQSMDKQRQGDETVYSLTKGYDKYLQGALDWVYHIADIQRRRALENYIRYTHSAKGVQEQIAKVTNSDQYDAEGAQAEIDRILQESKNPLGNFVTDLRRGTNTLAGKKSGLDRETEYYTNRRFYSTMTNISSRVSANMVAGSVSSAVTNFIPITQSWMEVSPLSSLGAMKDTIRSMFRDDGTIAKSAFLTNRLRKNEALYKSGWDKVSDKIGLLTEKIDSFTAQTVWRSKYQENISKFGMSEAEAIKNADQFAENVMAGRSRGNQPTIFDAKNPLTKMLTSFQLEVANQYGYLFKDAPIDMKERGTARIAAGYAGVAIGAYVYNLLTSALTGRDAATDPIGIFEDIIRDIIGEATDDDEESAGKEIANVTVGAIEELAQELPFIGGLLGGGRVPISSALPYDNVMDMITGTVTDIGEGDLVNLTKEWMNPVIYGVSPMGGGQIKKSIEGAGMFLNGRDIKGSYTADGKLRYEVEPNAWNVIQAVLFGQYASKTARAYFDQGRKPLSEGQLEEYSQVDMDMQEYWDLRDALNSVSKQNEKMDIVAGLDLPIDQKNLLANNIANRKDPIDLTGYEDFGSFAEFDFYNENPERYEFLKKNGISAKEYQDFDEDTKKAWTWARNDPERFNFVRQQGVDIEQIKEADEETKKAWVWAESDRDRFSFLQGRGIDLEDIEDFTSDRKETWNWMYKNQDKFRFLQEHGITVEEYESFSSETKEAWKWAADDKTGYMLSQVITDDPAEYKRYMSLINKTTGSDRKQKIIAYIESLDISDIAKKIMIRSEYSSVKDYDKEIIRYISGMDTTYAQKKAMLEKLGFKVDSNGKITG